MRRILSAIGAVAALATGNAQAQDSTRTHPVTLEAAVNFTNKYALAKGFVPYPHASMQQQLAVSIPIKRVIVGAGLWQNVALEDGKNSLDRPLRRGAITEADVYAFVGTTIKKLDVSVNYQRLDIAEVGVLEEAQLTLKLPGVPLKPTLILLQDFSRDSRKEFGGQKQQYFELNGTYTAPKLKGFSSTLAVALINNRQYTVETSGFAGARFDARIERAVGPVVTSLAYGQYVKTDIHEFVVPYKQISLGAKIAK